MAANGVDFLRPLDGTRYELETPALYRARPQHYRVEKEALREELGNRIEKARLAVRIEHRAAHAERHAPMQAGEQQVGTGEKPGRSAHRR